MTMIDKAEALRRIVLTGEQMAGVSSSEVVDAIHRDVAALPASGVGVKPRIVPLHTQSLYGVCIGGRWDGWVMVKHPDGHWVSHNKPDAIDPMGDVIAALSPALAPTDAAQAREAALREAAQVLLGIMQALQRTMTQTGYNHNAQIACETLGAALSSVEALIHKEPRP